MIGLIWSEWRDSNTRPLGPEAINDSFLTTFVRFLVLLSPKTMLSDALVRTVSTQSKSVDGQRCGHRVKSDSLKARKLNRIYRVLSFYCDLSIAYFSQIVNNLSWERKNWGAVVKEKSVAIVATLVVAPEDLNLTGGPFYVFSPSLITLTICYDA